MNDYRVVIEFWCDGECMVVIRNNMAAHVMSKSDWINLYKKLHSDQSKKVV